MALAPFARRALRVLAVEELGAYRLLRVSDPDGPAPAPGVYVNIESRLPLSAKGPDTVFIPAGATSATFTVTTFPSDTTTVLMSASLGSSLLETAIGVNPPPTGPCCGAL